MIIPKHEVAFNGKKYKLQTPGTDEAEKLAMFILKVYPESPHMVNTPEELDTDTESYRALIEEIGGAGDSFQIAVFDEGEIIANAGVVPVGRASRIRHRCTIGVAVRKSFRNRKIGTYLVRLCLDLASEIGYRQAEVAVSVRNSEAIALLNSLGFNITGCIPEAYHAGDGYTDELNFIARLDSRSRNILHDGRKLS